MIISGRSSFVFLPVQQRPILFLYLGIGSLLKLLENDAKGHEILAFCISLDGKNPSKRLSQTIDICPVALSTLIIQ